MTYAIYHIPGVKIGVTNNIKSRVEEQQGYEPGEYEILEMSDDIDYISKRELYLQERHGYKVDRQLYKELFNNNFIKLNNMDINVTEMTTTFPCPVNKLKGRLMDNIGMGWKTEAGHVLITKESINWIMDNVKSSQFTNERCYVYNRAFARWFDNNNAHDLDNAKMMNEVEQKRNGTLTGGLAPTGIRQQKYCGTCPEVSMFELIRQWAEIEVCTTKAIPKHKR